MAIRKCRLISFSEEIIDGQPIYVSSNCHPVKALKFEPAGHAFHAIALKLLGYGEEEEADGDDQSVASDKDQNYIHSSDPSYSSKGKKKSGSGGKQQDHYALLGLSHLRYLATEDQIKKAYRETALKYHPDKQAALLLAEETESAKLKKKDEIESHFKAIQEAYEALNDPVKRRIYDSTDEFDDEIPTDCSPQDFFKVFGPAFMRNGRWSVVQPVPSLGNDGTPLKEVDKFYDFWYSFKSWREFPHEDEYDVEQAESRDHKRWMERQNLKLSEKARKEEYARIRVLVENAYKRDPRVLRRKEEEKAEKQRKKEAKFLAKKRQEEEAARKAEEEKLRKEEEERLAAEAALQQKKVKEKEKKLLRRERARLRSLSTSLVSQHLLGICEDDIEGLCTSLGTEQLRNICEKMESKEGSERAAVLREAQGLRHKPDGEKQNQQQNGAVQVNGNLPFVRAEKKEKPWEREEIELLRKGMLKYPKGTSRRWEVISEYIGTGRAVEEILKATKTVLLQKPDTAKAFDSFLEKRKPAQSISSPLTTREEVAGTPAAVPTHEETAAKVVKVKAEESSSKSGSGPNHENSTAENGGSGSDEDVWSAVQERALVQALKTFPKETSQRWERVATAVPGKTVNQCRKKFALLKENFRNKKNTV
ncbi:hypothetical protein SAY86_029445 [Trapa natans]|uniref:DnaJ homolog subfamily C member 2-like n=1 Tax=Trapa natans TaxID=22666 RepID=A0AAN7R9M6_TRANT|nr:hypothetical protein SAY86_029445 [Trapa natans]